MAISQHGTSVLFTSHPKDGLVVNLYIPHNRRTLHFIHVAILLCCLSLHILICVVLCCVVLCCVALRCVVSCCVVLCRVVLHAYCNYICYLALWCSPFHTCCTLWCVALYTYYMLFKRNIALLISCHTDIKLLPFYMFSCIHFASWCVALHT